MRSMIVSCVAAIGLGSTLLVVAQTAPPAGNPNPPGWKYGGYNCGCLTAPDCHWSTADCDACCAAAEYPPGPLNPAQVAQCQLFCAQMGQPCFDCP